MTNSILQIKTRNIYDKIVYFCALTLFLLAKYIEVTTIYYTDPSVSYWVRNIRLLSYLIVFVFLVFQLQYKRYELTKFVAIMLCMVAVSYVAQSITLLTTFMFIFAAKDYEIRDIIRYVVTLQIASTIFIVIGCILGAIPDWTYFIADRYRHSLGFFYPNRLSTIFFFISIALSYLRGERFNLITFVTLETVNCLIFFFTNSRMAFALTTLALVAFLGIRILELLNIKIEFNKNMFALCLFAIPLICILLCWMYNPSIRLLNMFNGMISNRLQMGNNALHSIPLTLFGQKNEWYGFGGLGYLYTVLPGDYNAVDCSYVKILLDNGIIMLVIVIAGYMLAAYNAARRNDVYFCMALVFVFAYCMIEPPLVEMGFNPFVFSLSTLITFDGVIELRSPQVVY